MISLIIKFSIHHSLLIEYLISTLYIYRLLWGAVKIWIDLSRALTLINFKIHKHFANLLIIILWGTDLRFVILSFIWYLFVVHNSILKGRKLWKDYEYKPMSKNILQTYDIDFENCIKKNNQYTLYNNYMK